jgi:outer membrane protein assembly factor BamB
MHRFSGSLFVLGLCIALAGCLPGPSDDTSSSGLSTVTSAPAAPAPKGDWPLFRGDAQATGVAPSPLPDKPELLWTYEVPKGAFEGTPAIVDGVVYLGDLDGRLLALDLNTGDVKWEKKFEMGFNASPSVRHGRIYLGDLEGMFRCFDCKDGAELWKHETMAEINSSANFYKEFVLVGSQDATLYCLDAKSGEQKWKFGIADQIRCSPTVVENRCFLAGCDGKLHIVDLDKGEAVADVPIDSPTGSTPAARGDMVYFGNEGGVFFGINWKEAKTIWTWQDEKRSQAFRSSAAVTDDAVIIGGRDKTVRAFEPQSNTIKWEFTTRQRIDASPVVVGERVFIAAADGRIYALNLADGTEQWQYEAGGGFAGSPAIADGRLVIASDKGTIFCFGAK